VLKRPEPLPCPSGLIAAGFGTGFPLECGPYSVASRGRGAVPVAKDEAVEAARGAPTGG